MSLLEQDTIRKGQVDKKVKQMEFDTGNNNSGEYKVEAVWDSVVYTIESKSGHLPGLYYLVSWKRYPEKKNIWEPASTVQHLRKLISLFFKDYPDKPSATFLAINTIPPMAKPTVRSTVKPTKSLKWKQGQLANSTNKQAKKNWAAFNFYHVFGQIWVNPELTSSATLHVTACDF